MKLLELLFGKKKEKNPFALKTSHKPYQKKMVKNLKEYFDQEKCKGVFTGEFFSRLYSYFLRTCKFTELTGADINPGFEYKEAWSLYHHGLNLCSLRSYVELNLESFRKSEVKKVRLTVDRQGKECVKNPKTKIYKLKDDIPLYPCLDCECDPRCDIWYKGEY